MSDPSVPFPVEAEPDGDATRLVALDRLDRDLFRNRFSAFGRDDHLFGGQVLAQALAAASATMEAPVAGGARVAHSLHGYFLRAGAARRHVIYQVERTRDGGRFSTRRVVALQGGVPIFHMECSFQLAEPGFAHQLPAPLDVAPPDALADLATLADRFGDRLDPGIADELRRPRLIELRPVDPEQLLHIQPVARRRMWLRVPSAAACDDPLVHQQLIAYLSDYWLAATALVPHRVRMAGPDLFIASLDHALWLHHPHRASDWLLYDTDSPSAGGARGLTRGLLYDQAGTLIASVAQEALIRPRGTLMA